MKSRNEQALKAVAIALAALTYAGAVAYGDIQFLTVMDKAFPSNGILRALAMAGAVMTAASALTLPLALHWWFAPGLQFLWGIAFWVLDIFALGLNAILAYEIAIGNIDSIIGTWQILSPATPLLAVIGWGIAFLLDPSHKERQALAEMQADQIETYSEQMRKAAKSEEVYAEILVAAKIRAREFAESLSGRRNSDTSNGTLDKRETSEHASLSPQRKERSNGNLQNTRSLDESVEIAKVESKPRRKSKENDHAPLA